MHLIETQTMDTFFRDLLEDALSTERVDLADRSRSYLVQLFADFSRVEELYRMHKAEDTGTPTLAWLYERAQQGDPADRFDAWRHLGDVALMVAGFFGRYLERRRAIVGLDYYVQMGAGAYGTAASYTHWRGFGLVLEELATNFRALVDVMTRIGEATTLPVGQSLERLYERWIGSAGGEDLHERLTRMGAAPVLVGIGKA